MSDEPRLRIASFGGVGRATLARPAVQNALDRQAVRELRQALDEFEADGDVRAVLINGEGDHFCAGPDVKDLAATLDMTEGGEAEDTMALGRLFLGIRQMTKPVIAAVQGRVLAGGAGLATACDVVLARDDALFGYPEVRLGTVPAIVMTMLRRSVGEKHAFDLVASGRLVKADEAERLGLVSRVLPAAAFNGEVERIVLGIASHSTRGMAYTKRLFYALDGLTFRDSIEEGVRTNLEARAAGEARDDDGRSRERA
ncbi:MAG: enoyl-CoA hydratase/isomerase family protein [Gemmatimonadaceae bacterium]|nr:enoyl-CoA hydratase/isomerase family protein [Gemmatimonadaceae bacterium]